MEVIRYPLCDRLQGQCVNIRVDPTSSKKDEIAEEISLEDGEGKGIIGLEDVRDWGVKMADEMQGYLVGDDLDALVSRVHRSVRLKATSCTKFGCFSVQLASATRNSSLKSALAGVYFHVCQI